MGREEKVDPFKDLKLHSTPDHQIKEINISGAVLSRIDALNARNSTKSYKPARRFPIYATALFIVLLTYASVYAASELIQIRDRAGDVKIKSVILESKTQIIPYKHPNEVPAPTYRDRVLELVKPGQLLAYYIKDGSSNPTIQYLHNTDILTSYNDFKELLVRTSAPLIKEPAKLPEGFTFKYGSVMPILPNEHDTQTSAEHARLLGLFQQRAAAEPDQDLFIEEASWSEANIAELEYENDSMNIRIQAMKNMIGMEIAFPAEYSQETVDIGDIETIFASGSIKGYNNFQAIWYDEMQKTHYQVRASGNVNAGLTAEQFKRIVESMVKS